MRSVWNVALLSIALGFATGVFAQAYPQRTVTFILTAAPGDGSDIAMRLMAEDLRKALNAPLALVNQPGAGGVLAVDSVVRAGKDGYTLLFTNNAPLTFRPVIEPDTTRYDPVRDLVPLGMVSRTPFLVAVRSDLPVGSLAEFVAHAKKKPGAMRMATVGTGSVGEFTVDTINAITGAGLVAVPYKGATPAVNAVTGGQVEATAITMSALIGGLKAKTLRPLVISSRYPDFPQIPTWRELGHPGNLIGVWTGFFAPAGIAPEVRNVLVPALRAAITNPATTAKMLSGGLVTEYNPPDTVLAEIREEQQLVRDFARRAGLVK